MTKVEAIKQVILECGGTATLNDIYEKIEDYYPSAKISKEWQAGIRGVLYREIKRNRMFKKIGLSIYALSDYAEAPKPSLKDKIRMHSFIEGLCLEIGNYKDYETYTADPSALYRDKIRLNQIATLPQIPNFTYEEIIKEVRWIDVIWFNKKGLPYPQKIFEIVDSVGTLNGAFNRSLQLKQFKTEFYIVAPERHRERFHQTINKYPYNSCDSSFSFINYEQIQEFYESVSKSKQLENELFG